MHVLAGTVHRTDGKHHIPPFPNRTVVDAVHTCPADDISSNGCAEIAAAIFIPLNAEGRQGKFVVLICLVKVHFLPPQCAYAM